MPISYDHVYKRISRPHNEPQESSLHCVCIKKNDPFSPRKKKYGHKRAQCGYGSFLKDMTTGVGRSHFVQSIIQHQ